MWAGETNSILFYSSDSGLLISRPLREQACIVWSHCICGDYSSARKLTYPAWWGHAGSLWEVCAAQTRWALGTARQVVWQVRCAAQSPHTAGSHPELSSKHRSLTQLRGEGVELPCSEIRTSWPPVEPVICPSCKNQAAMDLWHHTFPVRPSVMVFLGRTTA